MIAVERNLQRVSVCGCVCLYLRVSARACVFVCVRAHARHVCWYQCWVDGGGLKPYAKWYWNCLEVHIPAESEYTPTPFARPSVPAPAAT